MTSANLVGEPALPARYALGERLGQGASGETFAAIDTTDGAACGSIPSATVPMMSTAAAAAPMMYFEVFFRGVRAMSIGFFRKDRREIATVLKAKTVPVEGNA